MAQLSELDVQNLRHLIGGSETCMQNFLHMRRKQLTARSDSILSRRLSLPKKTSSSLWDS